LIIFVLSTKTNHYDTQPFSRHIYTQAVMAQQAQIQALQSKVQELEAKIQVLEQQSILFI